MQCTLAQHPQWMTVRVHAQAGTYIKEFVTGDFGRTHPSISSMLDSSVELVQLDVVDVLLDLEGEETG